MYSIDQESGLMVYPLAGKDYSFDLIRVFGELVKIDNANADKRAKEPGSQDYLGDVAALMTKYGMGEPTWGQAEKFYATVCREAVELKKKLQVVPATTADSLSSTESIQPAGQM